MYFNLFEQKNC